MTAADSERSSAAGGSVVPRPASSVILLRDG
jgi:hypothetical protein